MPHLHLPVFLLAGRWIKISIILLQCEGVGLNSVPSRTNALVLYTKNSTQQLAVAGRHLPMMLNGTITA